MSSPTDTFWGGGPRTPTQSARGPMNVPEDSAARDLTPPDASGMTGQILDWVSRYIPRSYERVRQV